MKNPLRQLIRSVSKDFQVGSADFLMSKRSMALRRELQQRAMQEAADMVVSNMPRAQFCNDKLAHLDFVVQQIEVGLVLEFGVYKGTTLNHLASQLSNQTVYGFDGFEGLPEAWVGNRYSPRNFNRKGMAPKVKNNAELVIGWFDDTLAPFLESHPGTISLLHIDCDIYSSTATVFRECEDRLVPGSIIAFDEYFNYHGWRLHEYKAFMEFIERTSFGFEYLGYSGTEVSVRLTEKGAK